MQSFFDWRKQTKKAYSTIYAKRLFSLEGSNAVKRVAVILILVHHLFYNQATFEAGGSLRKSNWWKQIVADDEFVEINS